MTKVFNFLEHIRASQFLALSKITPFMSCCERGDFHGTAGMLPGNGPPMILSRIGVQSPVW